MAEILDECLEQNAGWMSKEYSSETPDSPVFHLALLAQGYPQPWADLALG